MRCLSSHKEYIEKLRYVMIFKKLGEVSRIARPLIMMYSKCVLAVFVCNRDTSLTSRAYLYNKPCDTALYFCYENQH